MHVRIAWEIYNHQQKEKSGGAAGVSGAGVGVGAGVGTADKDKLRGYVPAAPPAPYRSPYELPPAPYLPPHHTLGMIIITYTITDDLFSSWKKQ